jgi:hypothetical protein
MAGHGSTHGGVFAQGFDGKPRRKEITKKTETLEGELY